MIILASQSTIRQHLLRQAGVRFHCMAAPFDEASARQRLLTSTARKLSESLAVGKALATANACPEAIVIGADQTLECNGCIFTKARSIEEAAQHLKALRNRAHSLYAAVTVAKGQKILFQVCVEARMTMRNFSDEFLGTYLATEGDAIMASVGCYHFEAQGIQLFERVEGDYHAILGLPLLPLLAFLREIGEIPQ